MTIAYELGEDPHFEVFRTIPEKPRVIACMATMPGREEALVKALESLSPQVDQIIVSCDAVAGWSPPKRAYDLTHKLGMVFSNKPLGDANKLTHVMPEAPHTVSMLLTVDDDLRYPPNYAAHHLDCWRRLARNGTASLYTVLGIHGTYYRHADETRYRSPDAERYRCLDRKPRAVWNRVHVLGTGTTSFLYHPQWGFSCDPLGGVIRNATGSPRRSLFQLFQARTPRKQLERNVADLHLASYAQYEELPLWAIPKPAAWLELLVDPKRPSIWNSGRAQESEQAQNEAALMSRRPGAWRLFG